jgi:hypothetical protein
LNEPLITAVILRAGLAYIQLHEGDGADLLVIDAPMYFVEVKNPVQPPSKRRLTDDELKLQAECKDRGIGYEVVEHPEHMATIINRNR